jgi:hypothetical protein
MLSEALQRNAKHEARLSNISVPFSRRGGSKIELRLKAWPRGLRPLRCSFASLRMTTLRCLLRISTARDETKVQYAGGCPAMILETFQGD